MADEVAGELQDFRVDYRWGYVTLVVSRTTSPTTDVGENGGSRALGDVHDEVREDIERADARQLAASLNRDLVRPLVFLNRGPQQAYPKIQIGRPEQADSEKLTNALSRLVPLGLRVRQSEVRRKLNLEEPEDGDDVLASGRAQPPAPGRETARRESAGTPARKDAPRDVTDALADQLDRLTADAQDQAIDDLRALVDGAQSLEQVAEALLDRYAGLDAEELADRLREALVLAELVGRDDAGA